MKDTTKHFVQSGILFVLVWTIGYFIISTEGHRLEQNHRMRVSQTVLDLAAKIEAELNANVFLATGMMTLVSAVENPTDEEIASGLRSLYKFGRHVRNVGAAPDNTLRFVYPLEGNESVIGLHYPDSPQQWPAVKRAIDLRETIVAGPVELLQGGSGIICRTPLFLEDGRYWGLVSLVMDTDSMFQEVGLRTVVDGAQIALRGKDGLGADGEVFFGDPDLFDDDAVTFDIHVPGGEWVIAASPVDGWRSGQTHLFIYEFLNLAGALLIGIFAFRYQRDRLFIESSEKRLRAIMETTEDCVIVYDDDGTILECNIAGEKLFAYPPGALIGTPVAKLTPSEENRIEPRESASEETPAQLREVVCYRRDGQEFPAEVTLGDTAVGQRRLHVAVVRDISERKLFEKKLVELATTDSLTGVLTRGAFMEEAEDAFRLAKRHSRPMSVMMIDADYFKRINDTHGHHVGDEVLIELASLIGECLRTTDKFGRYGGEEFSAVLQETNHEEAVAVAERVLEVVRNARVPVEGSDPIQFTVSVGIATMNDESKDLDALIQTADENLYKAKDAGRDQWCG